ncbi:transporter [Reichenbachiella sp. MALMAid0571]|uniref:transporter n=1 Tax=Reichenbachiella sp. MALMAid0571 TaxID=3143939 RepID=UPI0032DE62DF
MRYFTTLIISLLVILGYESVLAQGCVAIRGMSSCSGNMAGGFTLSKGEFLSGAGIRYFKSFRHFRGSEEEANRLEDGTEVINRSYFLDLSLNYGITDRLYGNIIIPFVHHDRSSMYEHGGNPPNGLGERHQTSSKGLSDIRFGLGYWLVDPQKEKKFNYAVALGLKLPTGNYDYKDTFYNQGENRDESRTAVVDQSIQPGDGGVGITVDIQGYHSLSHNFIISTNLYYLSNFQKTNGIATRNGRSEFSCPDQYAARIGAYYNTKIHGVSVYLGGRIEGVSSDDLIGSSEGYRRPGYATSIEPGIGYNMNNYSFNLSVPIAIKRNRTQSYEDKQRTIETGVYTHGDAAFADYLLNFTFAYRFGGSHKMPTEINLN